ncbi:hypothetical protein PHLGIDRAFT_42695, partial [Phlebiopsis gigantea 11061_1 CR5-6]
IVDVFKIKPFALEPIYDSWPSAPIFQGNPSRDQPVDDWLAQIKEGCLARRVPKEYWHKVAQHYLGPHARARFDELKAVMRTLHGGRYMWNWKRFKCAMRNMGWEIDVHKTEEIKVQRKPSGVWWIVGGRRERAEPDSDAVSVSSTSSSVDKDLPAVPSDASTTRPVPKKAMTWDFASFKGFPTPKRSNTTATVVTMSSISTTPPPPYTPPSEKASAQSMLLNAAGKPADPPTATEVAHAPTWLLNASQALGFLATEHPKAMTAISAVLITIGSIPALPAIATGAGGAFLASGTAQAIGSIAVGVGS